MSILFLIGLALTLVVYVFDRKTIRFDIQVVSKFLVIMFLVTLLRTAIMSLASSLGYDVISIGSALSRIKFYQFALVFWEDAVFAMSIYYIKDVFKLSKYIWIPIAVILSAYFGYGHVYQGDWVGVITCFIPFFVFYKYGAKYGFGTTMVCHIAYDMITYATVKLAPYIIF